MFFVYLYILYMDCFFIIVKDEKGMHATALVTPSRAEARRLMYIHIYVYIDIPCCVRALCVCVGCDVVAPRGIAHCAWRKSRRSAHVLWCVGVYDTIFCCCCCCCCCCGVSFFGTVSDTVWSCVAFWASRTSMAGRPCIERLTQLLQKLVRLCGPQHEI